MLRYFVYIIEIIVTYLLSETLGLISPIFGARPVLLLPVVVSTAVFESETATMGFGLFCGILLDFGTSGDVALGFRMPLFSVLCFCAGLMAVHLLWASLLTDLPLSTAAIGLILLL